MTLGVTGHWPDKLGGFRQSVTDRLVELALSCLRDIKPEIVITGMAQGWDQAIAASCIYLDIPFVAAVPFEGQELLWPEAARAQYRSLPEKASVIEVISEGGFSVAKMQVRNKWIVDHSDKMLALWNGSVGGTCNCVAYAKPRIPVMNCWTGWKALE